jgi:hypothetical protein
MGDDMEVPGGYDPYDDDAEVRLYATHLFKIIIWTAVWAWEGMIHVMSILRCSGFSSGTEQSEITPVLQGDMDR